MRKHFRVAPYGSSREALTPGQARDLLEIVEDRYDKGSPRTTSGRTCGFSVLFRFQSERISRTRTGGADPPTARFVP